jgi:hypothetical protein
MMEDINEEQNFLRLRSPERKAVQSSKRHGRKPALRAFLFAGRTALQIGVFSILQVEGQGLEVIDHACKIES